MAISTGFLNHISHENVHFVLIPSERTSLSKQVLNELATLDSFEIISPFLTSGISGKVVTLTDITWFNSFSRTP